MAKAKFKEWLEETVRLVRENKSSVQGYVPFQDAAGNPLGADEILFTNERLLAGMETLSDWGIAEQDICDSPYISLDTEGIKPVYDECGNFPVAVKSEDGKLIAYTKISAKTLEVLPVHAGCVPVIDTMFVGAPSSSKTTFFLQVTDPSYHDMIARYSGTSFEDDLPTSDLKSKRENERIQFRDDHVFPQPTPVGEVVEPYWFYVQCMGEDEKMRRVLLKINDVSGEECIGNVNWDSNIYNSNTLVLTVGADDLLAGEKGRSTQYPKVLNQILPRLSILRRDYSVLVLITKADMLDKNNTHLQPVFINNSIEKHGEVLYQTTHSHGFDAFSFNEKSACIEKYLEDICPNFYYRLRNAIPNARLAFGMIASVGDDIDCNTYGEYAPFNVDEPITYFLWKEGLYPSKVEASESYPMRVESVKGVPFFKKAFSKVDKMAEKMTDVIFGEESKEVS